ncbi:MAG: low molecular weight protein arginine phosphatase [Chloroflexi bacterium]|nr:MAG: low molecular weight protein arginine phosphatase [Chloroflexota bacterium]
MLRASIHVDKYAKTGHQGAEFCPLMSCFGIINSENILGASCLFIFVYNTSMPSILFVCTANICRSPIASALFRATISKEVDASDWVIDSAGTWAVEGKPAAEYSQAVVKALGQDLSTHRSKSITMEMLRSYDLVLVMEAFHKEALAAEFPEYKGKIFQLSELTGRKFDVRDPYGSELEDYRDTAKLINGILREGLPKIRELLARN